MGYIYLMGVGKNGGGGVSYGATVCNSDKDQRISFVQGPTTSDMTADKLKTTNAAQIKKLASMRFNLNQQITIILALSLVLCSDNEEIETRKEKPNLEEKKE